MTKAIKGADMETAIALAIPSTPAPSFGHPMRALFAFDEDWTNLNHGSFGSAPLNITRVQQHFQRLSERRPDTFILQAYPQLLRSARRSLASVVGCAPENLVFVANATTGINTVLRGLTYAPGDVILYFDFIYGACGNTVEYVAASTAATAVRIPVSLPIEGDEDGDGDALVRTFHAAVAAVAAASPAQRVRIAVFDTVVSTPAVRLPFERLTAACRALGVLSLVDAAHGVGALALDLAALDADFVTSNVHKWFLAPRGCALLYVAPRNRALLASTLPTSWGYEDDDDDDDDDGDGDGDGDRWARRFDYLGTVDSTAYLCVPAAAALREYLGGEEKIMAYCNDVAARGAAAICRRLGTEVMAGGGGGGPVPMYNIRLPLDVQDGVLEWIEGAMDARGTLIPLNEYKGAFWARVSGQIYLELSDFEKGADVLEELIGMVKSGEWLK